MAVLAPFIIIGNLFVIFAVYKNYNLRTPTNFILTNRYIAVTKPLKYPTLVTPKRVGYAIASIWILSLIFLVLRGYIDLNEVQNANRGREPHSLGFVIFSLVVVSLLVLTLLVIVVSNLRIMQIAVRQARAIANQTINDQNNCVAPAAVERRLKAVKTTGIIVGVLVQSFAALNSKYFELRLTGSSAKISCRLNL
ncbi:histamine H2 receptor-like [Strongylocentrotus purpuratus]|uniref:G-protein coupled receptors family 1 profile domain-containing protein n=1 Tax=Strongylocentrotus purpuratus TaxID=7668 RepID=A0A7M7NYH5_STRPU|nr:histamine H2 receptor-like [Strongylocentrotus purpuratus]